jgi:hypothetical protein
LKKFDGVDYPTNAQIFDVNNNGVVDFELRYSQVSSKDEPVSESIISGRLIELNGGLILPRIGGETFKLAVGDTIKRPSGPISLVDYNRVIVSSNWDTDKWDAQYTTDGSAEDLGWVRFDINPADASVVILEAKHTSADFIGIE